MFNKIIARMNGAAADPAALAAALEQLGRDKIEADADIKRLQEERHKALLDDAADAALDTLERKLDRALARREKLTLSEPLLRERLAAAKGEAHRKAVARHADLMAAAYKELRAAVLAADAAQLALMRARDNAIAGVGEHEINAAIPVSAFGGFLGRGFAELWARENDLTLAAARASREPRSAPPARKKAAAPPPTPSKPTRMIEVGGPPPARTPRPLLTAATPQAGEVRCVVVRDGYEAAGQQHRVGDQVNLPAALAKAAAEHGAIEIIQERSNGA